MARYKDYDYTQAKLLPITFSHQILPGTFEYTLHHIVENELDLSIFESKYKNDETGAPAYDPAILLKIILYAYARGITSSREIEQCCRENVIFMALSADTQPHFTTIANFISSMADEIMPLFLEVLMICDEMGMIGKEMFAIDGCKLPPNAAKEYSGTKAELTKKAEKMQGAIDYMLKKHRQEDEQGNLSAYRNKEVQQQQTLQAQIKKIKDWLNDNDDKPGKGGKPIKSNITDNDSAKMKTSHGVLQGYDGVATVDARHQVVVHAQAFGQAQEHDLLIPMVEATRENFVAIGQDDVFITAAVTADSGFHTSDNIEALFAQKIDAYIADNKFRKRDPRFADAARYKERHKTETRKSRCSIYHPTDFVYRPRRGSCLLLIQANRAKLTTRPYTAAQDLTLHRCRSGDLFQNVVHLLFKPHPDRDTAELRTLQPAEYRVGRHRLNAIGETFLEGMVIKGHVCRADPSAQPREGAEL